MEHEQLLKSSQLQVPRFVAFCFLTLALSLSTAFAQKMFVKETNGLQTEYALSNIRKLTFETGYITIAKKENRTDAYALNRLRYMNFTDLSSGIEENKFLIRNHFSTYPNPVKDVLKLDVSETGIQEGTFVICNMEGRVFKIEKISNPGITLIDVRELPRGIYFCRYHNDRVIQLTKMIKQ